MTCSLVLLRLTLGFPTAEWFRATLVDSPYYHADSTGFPLSLYWKGVGFGEVSDKVIAMIFDAGHAASGSRSLRDYPAKALERRLPLDTVRARFYTLVLMYSLFSLKTVMDRSEQGNIMAGTAMLLMLVLLDGLEFLERWFRRPLLVPLILAACLTSLTLFSAFRPDLLPSFALPGSDNFAVMCSAILRSTSTPGEMIAPTSDSVAGDVSRGVEQVKDLLDAHGVGERQRLVCPVPSLLYSLLDHRLPTKYYAWACADPVMEQELIRELEQNHVRAFLHVNGIVRSLPLLTMCPIATAFPSCTLTSPGKKPRADGSRQLSAR